MKIKWSVLTLLFLLMTIVSCGSEQFGAVPKTSRHSVDSLSSYSHSSCSIFTLIKPKVDVLYIVDNSSSSYYIANDIKNALSNTVEKLSNEFDYRVIGTPLLQTASENENYQVMTNSSDLQGIPTDARRISSAANFSFFSNTPTSGVERGVSRLISFIDYHKNSLLRNNSHLVVVFISNGRDEDIESDAGYGNGETILNSITYTNKFNHLVGYKYSQGLQQLRIISLTAKTICQSGYRTALKSYVKLSNDIYVNSNSTDDNLNQDSFNLCSSGGINSIFSAINQSIKQVVLPHKYRYWPITFAENNEMVSTDEIKVRKISLSGSVTTLTRDTDWIYEDKGTPQTVLTRELPTLGEPIFGRHFIKFTNLITYPDCILVTSVSRTEYYGYIVLPQKPKIESVSVRINGHVITQSMNNGWSDQTSSPSTRNIKVPYPQSGDENPPVIRTGFMLKLNGSSNYYKSGDNVEVNYVPAGL
jgi:hypothetical protein